MRGHPHHSAPTEERPDAQQAQRLGRSAMAWLKAALLWAGQWARSV